MIQNKKLKIALVTVSLSGGGAERVAATLSCFFDAYAIEVHNIVFAGKIEYDYKGKLLHLETLKDKNNSYISRFKRFSKLYNYCKKHQFDFIIDFRVKEWYLQEFIIHNWVYKKFIQTVHSNSIDLYLADNKFFNKLLYKNAQSVVAVSNSIKEKIKQQHNIDATTIYNPIDFNGINNLSNVDFIVDYQYILAVGRMDSNVKQFDHLIQSYANSILPSNNVKLVILGEGKLLQDWIKLAEELHLQDKIIFEGSVANPYVYFKNALYTVMTSKYEGLPMVLIESLACATPVISYDFFNSFDEIIKNNYNGILVENQNVSKMTDALNNFFQNQKLYLHCKNNAQKSAEQFYVEKIGNQWLQFFNTLQ